MQAVFVIHHDFLAVHFPAEGIQAFLRTEAVIGLPFLNQHLRIFHVDAGLDALALNIRADSAGIIWSFIRNESRLQHRPFDDVNCAFHFSVLIRILDPEHERSSGVFCDQIGIKRRSQVANMHPSGRAGCKSCLHVTHDCCLSSIPMFTISSAR